MELRVVESEADELSGRYVFGPIEVRARSMTGMNSQTWSQTRYRDTAFRIKENGEVGQMGGRIKASSGDEIFRRLWEVPHVLPDGPVEVGTTWQVSRGVTLAEPYSTDIETRYEVVEVLDGDVWVEFSGNVLEVYRGSGGRYGTEGTLSGRFGFRPSLGAMIGWEWDYDYKEGSWDSPWSFNQVSEEGSIVLDGLGEDLPLKGTDQAIERNKDDGMALRHGVIVVGLLAAAMYFGFGR
jgi:hypothetical protein